MGSFARARPSSRRRDPLRQLQPLLPAAPLAQWSQHSLVELWEAGFQWVQVRAAEVVQVPQVQALPHRGNWWVAVANSLLRQPHQLYR